MTRWMHVALVGVAFALPLSAQKADERRVQDCEKKVAGIETKFSAEVKAMREVYRRVERTLAEARAKDGGEALVAELVRVLEPVVREARGLGDKPNAAVRAKVGAHLKRALPEACGKLEAAPLKDLADLLATKLLASYSDGGNVVEQLARKEDDVARAVLAPFLDEAVPFPERWNRLVAESSKATVAFKQLAKELAAAKQELAIAKDPLLVYQTGAPPGFARLPAGNYNVPYTEGYVGQGARRARERAVSFTKDVYVGLHEVTVGSYVAWLGTLPDDQKKLHDPKDAAGKPLWPVDPATGRGVPPPEIFDQPVVGVSFTSAVAYAASMGCRLPTEEEWAACATGSEQRIYPWGANWEAGYCNDREAGVAGLRPVGSFPKGRGPFGHYDLAGNASEWVATYESGKAVDQGKIDDANVAVRGGSYASAKKDVVAGWVWIRRARSDQDAETGFRLALDPKP